jgi:two-component system phosphate regulon sensor histidine kinase PhoR
MTRSLFTKVFGGYILIIVALSALILTFSFNTIRRHFIEGQAVSLEGTAISLRLTVAPLVQNKETEELNRVVTRVGNEANIRMTVIDSRGVVLADSKEDARKMENHGARPEIIEALAGKTGQAMRFSSTENQEMLYVAIPLQYEGRTVGAVRTSLFLRQIKSVLGSLELDIFNIALVVALISVVGAFIVSNSLSKPIKDLMAAARKIGSGDYSVRVFLKNRDEIGRLADTFNYMSEQLSESFSGLSRQKEELNSIISSLKEGLIVLDRRGTILLSNDSFRGIAGADQTDGKFYWEVFRNPEFTELIEKARKEKSSLIGDVEHNQNIYSCSVTFLQSREEVVSVFHDITEIRNLEHVKRDFVLNVSHELRTPLTAIKGFTETLAEEVGEKEKRYVDIIQRNTDRLINIVNDLLLLSDLEERNRIEVEEVNVKNLVENVLTIFDHRLQEKGLSLTLDIPDNIPVIKADAFKLEQMLVNLLDNAIKYTEKGEVRVTLASTAENAIIRIGDTGIGIPRDDLPRIFERFYVVDKSRSRKGGGTGLGLSIVKHIVLLHNGTIDVESRPGEGTTFTITIPVDPSQG